MNHARLIFVSSLGLFPALGYAAPTATGQSVTVQEDRTRGVTLTGTDSDGLPLTYALVTTGSAGTVTCAGPACTYTPSANFNGTDRFYFTASNGIEVSPRATVNITVNPVNDSPTVSARTGIVVNEDGTRDITLTGTDVDMDTLTFQVPTAPRSGTATVSGNRVTYRPNADFNGSDSFTYRAYDGTAYSSAASVSVTVTAVNDRPTVADMAVAVNEDTILTFTLDASDVDGGTLSPTFSGVGSSGSVYTTTTNTHGTFTVSGLEVTYTPPADFVGTDSFRFNVSDGTLSASAAATVSISIAAVNDPPVASDLWIRAADGNPAHAVFGATDTDGDALTYTIVSNPRRGNVVVWNGDRVRYTPSNPALRGKDSFTYRVSDGVNSTSAKTVVIDLVPELAKFPLDNVPVDPSIVPTTTADGYIVMNLPTAAGECAKSQSAQPTVEGTVAGASVGTVAVAAGHYNGLRCGYADYEDAWSSIYFIVNTGTPGEYEARLLDTGLNVEASGLVRNDGTLAFTTLSGDDASGGLVTYFPGTADDNAEVVRSIFQPVGVGTDSSPLYDAESGVTLLSTTNVPEVCGAAEDNDCGVVVAIDAGGNLVDILDEDDSHHAWGSSGCINVSGQRFCGFGPGSDADGENYQDDGACTVSRIDGMPTPPVSSGSVTTTLSFGATVDPGDPGCTPVEDLESSLVNGGLASDGTWIYAMAYGSDQSDDTTRIYQYDTDLNLSQTFEIPADASHRFTNGFHGGLLVAANGRLYTTGMVDVAGVQVAAAVELDPDTGATEILASERLSGVGLYSTGQLFVDAAGDEVIVYVVGTEAAVIRLSDGALVDAYELAPTTGSYTAAPVLMADGYGEDDALMFVSTDNVVTIVPDTGLAEDTEAPWPGARRDARMQATLP